MAGPPSHNTLLPFHFFLPQPNLAAQPNWKPCQLPARKPSAAQIASPLGPRVHTGSPGCNRLSPLGPHRSVPTCGVGVASRPHGSLPVSAPSPVHKLAASPRFLIHPKKSPISRNSSPGDRSESKESLTILSRYASSIPPSRSPHLLRLV